VLANGGRWPGVLPGTVGFNHACWHHSRPVRQLATTFQPWACQVSVFVLHFPVQGFVGSVLCENSAADDGSLSCGAAYRASGCALDCNAAGGGCQVKCRPGAAWPHCSDQHLLAVPSKSVVPQIWASSGPSNGRVGHVRFWCDLISFSSVVALFRAMVRRQNVALGMHLLCPFLAPGSLHAPFTLIIFPSTGSGILWPKLDPVQVCIVALFFECASL
jgi:hypothetical protein